MNQHIFKVVFDKLPVDKNYFKHIVSHKLVEMGALTHGATMKHITKGDFDNLPIPLPPLTEQRRIAALLDQADALRRKDRQLLAHYDKLAQSLFLDLFGQHVENGTTSLNEVVEVNPKKSAANLSDDLDVSFVPMNCVGEKGEFDSSQIKKLRDVKTGFTYFAERDVLFAKITPCMENGKGAIAKDLRACLGIPTG